MHPYLFHFGSFAVPTYGVLVALGMAVALWITTRLAREQGLKPDLVANLAIYCAFAGIIGAKLFMFLFDWRDYVGHPDRMFSRETLQAAGVFQGGLLLAIIVAYFYMRTMGLAWFKTADIFAPGIAIGHAIGRLGCLMAGCCYGRECTAPWAITAPASARTTAMASTAASGRRSSRRASTAPSARRSTTSAIRCRFRSAT